MSATVLDDEARPALLSGVRPKYDRVRGTWVLLAPERTLRLDPVGHAILEQVDGETPFRVIVARLAARYAAPPETVATDARAFLVSLMERRMAEVRA